MLQYWMFITRPEFWEQLKPPNNHWIFRRTYDYININDKAVVYVSRRHLITNIIEIKSAFKNRGTLTAFPFFTEVKYLFNLKNDNYINAKDHLQILDIFKGKSDKGWGATLQKSIISISKTDYDYLYKLLEVNSTI